MNQYSSNVPESGHSVNLGVAGMTVAATFGPGLEELAEEIAALWAHALSPVPAHGSDIALEYVLEGADTPEGAISMGTRPTATYLVSGNITRRMIQNLIGTRLLIHAGAVEHPTLGVVVVVGPSGAGKSTATTRLGRSGRYLSDELTILHPRSLAITAYPKPVSLGITGSRGKRDVALADLGLDPALEASAPNMVVLLDRRRGGEDSEYAGDAVRRLPLAEALMQLVSQTSSLWRVPRGLEHLARLLTSTGGALAVSYREADELAGLLACAPAGSEETFESFPRAEQFESLSAGTYGVAPYAQALALESGIFVLTEREAGHLPGISGIVWYLLRTHGELSPNSLERQVTEEIGEHPESSRLVHASLADLVIRGWVRRG
ncbi:MAG: hypothetical protein ACTHWV_05925 [Brachybacterium sp.]